MEMSVLTNTKPFSFVRNLCTIPSRLMVPHISFFRRRLSVSVRLVKPSAGIKCDGVTQSYKV